MEDFIKTLRNFSRTHTSYPSNVCDGKQNCTAFFWAALACDYGGYTNGLSLKYMCVQSNFMLRNHLKI